MGFVMGNTIVTIPVDSSGGKLYLKDLREDKDRIFVKYKSSINNVPWQEVEVFIVDGGKNAAITGEDGTILWRFNIGYLKKLK